MEPSTSVSSANVRLAPAISTYLTACGPSGKWDWRVAWGAAGWCTLLDKNDPRVSKFKTEFAAQLLTEGEPKLWNETFY
jgi:hypothetical protein